MSVGVELGEVGPLNDPFNDGLERRAKGGEVAVYKLFLCFAQSAFQVRPIEIVGSGVEGVFVFVEGNWGSLCLAISARATSPAIETTSSRVRAGCWSVLGVCAAGSAVPFRFCFFFRLIATLAPLRRAGRGGSKPPHPDAGRPARAPVVDGTRLSSRQCWLLRPNCNDLRSAPRRPALL